MELRGATEAQVACIAAAQTGHLATVDEAGRPHVVPICFALLDGRIYSPLDEKPKRVGVENLRRVRNIRANPSVCLVVDRYSEDWSELAWVQIRAEAEVLPPGGGEHLRAVRALRGRYLQYEGMALEERPILRLTPVRVVSWGV